VEDGDKPSRPEDMYSTYEDARARERELLQLAQRDKVGPSGPKRERRPLFRLSVGRFVEALRERYSATASKPAASVSPSTS
jgi:hypothetical protein